MELSTYNSGHLRYKLVIFFLNELNDWNVLDVINNFKWTVPVPDEFSLGKLLKVAWVTVESLKLAVNNYLYSH